ncbi:MAG: rhomboid family intramembrane serine protease [Candidatus Aminicenantales bacterium]|jgi:membrane associated rhomboid family serine protease
MFIPLRDENPTSRVPYITLSLIAVNVLVFCLGAFSPQGLQMSALRFGSIPYEITHFRSLDQALRVPPFLSLLTSLFVHGSLFHLLGNMLYLWIFGNNIEDVLGSFRFVLFYLACGLAAGLTQVAATPASQVPMIGASGAIAGVLGAYLVLFPGARVLTLVFVFIVRVPAAIVLGLWFVAQLLNVGMGGGVAWFAHVGGFLTGIGIVLVAVRRKAGRRA